jgi:5'-nucleotidase
MNILISNDDGYQAPGIEALATALEDIAVIHVVAPDRDRSGASNSLTLDNPIRARQVSNGFTCVNGTPTDCVHLAITGLLDVEPDMVVAGINSGANLGDDVLYSGTVAAAMEGRFLGFPAIAVSLVTERSNHYDTAARVAVDLVQRCTTFALPADTILNVNVPDLPWDDLKGMQATRLGHRHKSESVIKQQDPRGRPVYWVGPAGPEQDAGPGTDFHAVRSGYVSITPLDVDLTRYDAIDGLASWLAE